MPTDATLIRIESWDPQTHDRTQFDCGEIRLNNYLKLSARKQQQNDMTRVYVAVKSGQRRVLGYHTINAGTINVLELAKPPKGTPSHGEIPVLFLGQVAVDKRAQGRGLGGLLMLHVFAKACVIADEIGCHAVLLDVMSDGGSKSFNRRKSWYESFGFQSFAGNSARMFMTMNQVRALNRF